MNATDLYRAGKLAEAVQVLSTELRDNPADSRRRTFLFELLCFTGDFDRAMKQLDLLGSDNQNTSIGALVYRSAIVADRLRRDAFATRTFSETDAGVTSSVHGFVNGKAFTSITDADPRIGPRLEVFAGGNYLWVPFAHIASLEIPTPARLRDLLWTPAVLRTGPAFKSAELGEVLLPALYPFSFQHADEQVKLGRMTVWEADEQFEEGVPFGQKLLLIDGEEVPLLEIRSLEIEAAAEKAAS